VSFHVILAVASKECLDGVRDRRALLSALLFPLFGPILIALMLASMADPQEREDDIDLPVLGGEHAPLLVGELGRAGIRAVEAPADPGASVQRGEHDLVLLIGEDYGARFSSGRPAIVELVADDSRLSSHKLLRRVEAVLHRYGQKLAAKRLLARGVDPYVAQPVQVQTVNLATPRTKAANLLEMIGMFAIMAAFLCNMYVAIDSTAGERERGSLEPLLLNPAPRLAMVIGKWLATVLFGLCGVALMLACSAISLQQVPLEGLGMRLVFGFNELWLIFSLLCPLVLMAGAGQLLLASFARSFKEAQTYLSLALFLPMLPGMFLMFKQSQPALWMAAIPALSHQFLTGQVLRGEALSMDFVMVSALSSLALTALFLHITVLLFRSETFFFRG
jgi:sodium transport system permease protein